ncbi:MAG: hypothetical protein IJU70_13325 [Lentisphaeria bacterium]|nr:hypothetical protein [Lentisphaeria bacterium]
MILFLAGAHPAAAAALLLLRAVWRPEEIGLFFLTGSLAALAGFLVVSKFRGSFSPWAGLCGAVLLTVELAAYPTFVTPVSCFLAVGGCAAYFVRTRRKNTFFPFAAGLAAGTGAVLFPSPDHAPVWWGLSAMWLAGLLLVNSVRPKYIRWLVLPFLLLQGVLLHVRMWRGPEDLPRIRAEQRAAALSALPSSLVPAAAPGKLAVLQVTRSGRDLPAAPWREFSYVEKLTSLPVDDPVPVGTRLDALPPVYDLVSLEVLPRWPQTARKALVKKLFAVTRRERGCVVFPEAVLPLLPPGETPVPVPSVEGNSRFAAGKLPPSGVSPQALDARLQRHLAASGDRTFMPPGAFTALFSGDGAPGKPLPAARESSPPAGRTALFWCVFGVLWLAVHLGAARTRRGASFIAGADNAASAALIVLAAFLLVAENRIYSALPETALLWCLPLCIPFCGRKGKFERLLLVCSIVLPWSLAVPAVPAGWHGQSGIALAAALAAAASCGITGAKLLLEPGASRDGLVTAFFCGTALAGVLACFLLFPGTLRPVLAAATVLRIGCLVRL